MVESQELLLDQKHRTLAAFGLGQHLVIVTFHASGENDLAQIVEDAAGENQGRVFVVIKGHQLADDRGRHAVLPQFARFNPVTFLLRPHQ